MITPEQVPENVWVEVALRLESVGCLIPNSVAKLIVAEAINAWEGSYSLAENDSAIIRDVAVIILPLPQEASDE